MLGHANVSQTDTYLNAARMGRHESMKRYDMARSNPVANNPATEHRPVSSDKGAVRGEG
jgi:hypothetical protein